MLFLLRRFSCLRQIRSDDVSLMPSLPLRPDDASDYLSLRFHFADDFSLFAAMPISSSTTFAAPPLRCFFIDIMLFADVDMITSTASFHLPPSGGGPAIADYLIISSSFLAASAFRVAPLFRCRCHVDTMPLPPPPHITRCRCRPSRLLTRYALLPREPPCYAAS